MREDGKPFPVSTHELYVYLVGRVPDPRVSTPQTHVVDSAFVSVENKSGKKKTGGNGNKADDVEGKKLPTRPCNLCPSSTPAAEKLHWQTDCPYLERFHQMVSKETAKPKTKEKANQKKKVAFATVEEEDEIDAAWITFADTVVAAISDKRLGPSDILIDNAATVCIVNNAALLGTIYDLAVPRVVSGVGGSMTIYQEGYLPVIGRVLYCPDFMMSVISQSRVVKNKRLDLD